MAKTTKGGSADASGAKKARTEQKADMLFIMYYQLGPERSIENLAEMCTNLGLRGASITTLKSYSVRYEWQRRLLELTVKDRERREQDALNQIDKMNEQHVKINQGLLSLAVAGIQHYQAQIERSRKQGLGGTLNINVQDIVKLVAQAQNGERLARGQATSRTEVVIEVISTFVQEFGLIFIAVNDIADPAERKREYIKRADEMIREYYSSATGAVIDQIGMGGR